MLSPQLFCTGPVGHVWLLRYQVCESLNVSRCQLLRRCLDKHIDIVEEVTHLARQGRIVP